MFDVLDSHEELLKGAWITIQLTVGGSLLALVLAVLFGMAGVSSSRWVRGLNRVYVEFFRGTATLVLLYWFFYALPLVGFKFAPMFTAIMALGLNVGAYGAEVVRGAIISVPKAQYEATIALNLTPTQRMIRVILPQAVSLMLPPFGNLLIELMKGTAVVSLITIGDLTFRGKEIQQSTGETAWTFFWILVFYFVIAQVLQLFVRFAERRVDRMLGRRPSRDTSLATVSASAAGTGVGG
ncbi:MULTISPECIES: ectoine/hydroxyectoine ABC transporter permease subunit EhuC [Thermomonosporaceae]|uniref:ectoine/hydroxyectoine ABC transporter permease subunit EhuC n=1 Tax=Thermomonosporaceae TaxID=2012 RepID=UPI00255A8119|nr:MULTISPECIES: ectoine/hydroxyectoine ABC transporter permease subunit EhuC [Thermomonosporaceae]MDL4770898.1 ectoine/hydroxyectoine ABC transporter permease subunit EhuC [Actinomadura xylanilytica]